MNIFDHFRQGASGAAPAAAAPKPDSFVPGAITGAPDAAALEQQKQQQLQDEQNKSPLAEFSKLWDTETPVEGESPLPNWDDPASIVPAMNIDPAKLIAASKKLDYRTAINPERVKAALGGDVAAFTEVLNTVQQAAFANSSMATARFVEAALKRMAPSLINDALPHHVRKHSVREAVVGENPLFNDPAVAPMLEMLEAQLRTKFPKASAKEISDHAKKYLNGFGQAIQRPTQEEALRRGQPRPGDKLGTGKEDWTDFFDVSTTQQP